MGICNRWQVFALLSCFCVHGVVQSNAIAETKTEGGATLNVIGDISGSGASVTAKVKASIKLKLAGIDKDIDVGHFTVTQSSKTFKQEYKFGGGDAKLKATVRVYPLKKVQQHWESDVSLTVRVNDKQVAHPVITLKY